jgi:uncharacterized membrane protein
MSARRIEAMTMHPALRTVHEMRRANLQDRIADRITAFAGSMIFVYVHVGWFLIWIGLRIEHYPFGLLTMIVSLEAIFLSTFVMISQNRADQKRQALADNEWIIVQAEERQNEQLIALSTQILELTTAIHGMTSAHTAGRGGTSEGGGVGEGSSQRP